jgi:hypothetical protein
VEHFIAEDLIEDRARRRVVVDDLPVDLEAAGRRLLPTCRKASRR